MTVESSVKSNGNQTEVILLPLFKARDGQSNFEEKEGYENPGSKQAERVRLCRRKNPAWTYLEGKI